MSESIQSVLAMGVRMNELKEQIDALQEAKTALQKEYDALRNNEIPDRLQSIEVPRLVIGSIGKTLFMQMEMHASIMEQSAGYTWLRDNGHGGLIKEYVHPSTFKAFAKEMLKEGVELPEDLFRVEPFMQARLRKG